ncbi:MAG: helix-turn-helix domain-containing protein [Chloroflexi bacterium]|nr:helix-turn-helix domain-containing protein [Chloroflexota bacterium]MCC6892658.1 helix-turn-helix domain-containing protein [Anaerolineae bacterium]
MKNPDPVASFGLRLTQAIDEWGVTGKELAAALNHSEATVSNWRNGKYLPDVQTLVAIARFFGKSVDWFLGAYNTAESVQAEHKGIVWRANIPANAQGQQRREINLGVQLFDALVRQNLDLNSVRKLIDFKNYDIETLYDFLKVALHANALRIEHVPRHADYEQRIQRLYPHLRENSVIVADIQDKNDATLIRAEFVAFLAANAVLNTIQYANLIGIGSGYTMLRMAEIVVPSIDQFRGTTWVPLMSFRETVTNHYGANYICELLANRFPKSNHHYYPFESHAQADDILQAHDNLRTAFISMNGLGRSSRSSQTAQDTGDFRTADFGEFARLRRVYQRLATPDMHARIGGSFLGYLFDKQGKIIDEMMDEVHQEVKQISIPRWKAINGRGRVWVVAARLYKALPVWIAIRSGLANSLVIDNEIAEFILEAER